MSTRKTMRPCSALLRDLRAPGRPDQLDADVGDGRAEAVGESAR